MLQQKISQQPDNPEIIHGNLVQVNHYGFLLLGQAGVGKSSLCIALLERGHRLVADDAVAIMRATSSKEFGSAPKNTAKLLHCRQRGIINVVDIYGKLAYLESTVIHFTMRLDWCDTDTNTRVKLIETLVAIHKDDHHDKTKNHHH